MLSGRGLCDELITRPKSPTDCGTSVCVIKKPRELEGHSPRWAAEPEKQTTGSYQYLGNLFIVEATFGENLLRYRLAKVATCYGRNRQCLEPRRRQYFYGPMQPPPVPTKNGYHVPSLTDNWPVRGVGHLFPSSADVENRVDGRRGSRLRGYHPVVPRPLTYEPYVHRL
jgi:hypothetical protein